jgi:hypothetical protein
MITKGNQRGGAGRLATHLLNAYDNDGVEVADVRGAVARDLHGAFAEWRAQAMGTQCKKYLYSLSVNPDQRQGPLSRAQYLEFIGRVEVKLGLSGQPRAVVFHVKHGREHAHVVWSRIDPVKMRAVHIGHDRRKLHQLADDFARDHEQKISAAQAFNRRADPEGLAERQQQERSGVSRADRVRAVTAAWNESPDGAAFVQALAARDYYLARGDQRGYVVVDLFGEIHSLARQIEGVRTKAVTERLAAFPPARLPDVKTAQAHAVEQRAFRAKQRDQLSAAHEAKLQRDNETAARRATLEESQERRLAALTAEQAAVFDRQTVERIALTASQVRPTGLLAFLGRITGIQSVIDARHREQRDALARRHRHELRDIERRCADLASLENRENQSFDTALRREEFHRIAAPSDPIVQTSAVPSITPVFNIVSAAPADPAHTSGHLQNDDAAPPDLKAAFNGAGQKATEPAKKCGRLCQLFNRLASLRDYGQNAGGMKAPEKQTPARANRPTSTAGRP